MAFPVLAQTSPRKLKIVITGAHPGDPEYGCGGTIVRYTDARHAVTLLYLNHGQRGCGSKSLTECGDLRTSEAAKACRILNAQPRFSTFVDGDARVDANAYEDYRKLITEERPDVVFTQWPVDDHRDHRAISMLTYDAWTSGRRQFALFYYEVSDGEDTHLFAPTDYVDITAVAERKKAACYAHASQSPDRYYALQDQVARFRGLERGWKQAEAFVRVPGDARDLLP